MVICPRPLKIWLVFLLPPPHLAHSQEAYRLYLGLTSFLFLSAQRPRKAWSRY